MKFGTERKKMAALAGLLLLAAYSIYTNVLSGPEIPADARRSVPTEQKRPKVETPQAPPSSPANSPRSRPRLGRAGIGEFRPTMRYARPEDRPDPMKVDPTLRLELVSKLQNVTIEGGMRSLFEFGAAPPPPTPDPKIKPIDSAKADAAKTTADAKPTEPVKPPPPPIPLKFYGFSSPRGSQDRRAFFLQGEDIFIAGEGELIQKRYRIVKIGLNSATVEDTQHEHHQQTLALEQPPVTG